MVIGWILEATAELSAAGITTARLDAELILAHTVRQNRPYLHAHPETVLTDRQTDIANARLALRLDFTPIAYIIGHKEFYGRRFNVTTATLIPRPESETMIELLKKYVGTSQALLTESSRHLIDVGTGSGALGITAKLELPELDVMLSDISRHALSVAQTNATMHHADVSLLRSDLLTGYPLSASIILANLPYVDATWERSSETDHEPAVALFAADNGLAVISKLFTQTPNSLKPGGLLFIEADPTQHGELVKRARRSGLKQLETEGYIIVFELTK